MIRVGELPAPVPGPADVLVRVSAVAVNPVDTYIRSGAYRTPLPMPFVVGRDLVGEVVEPAAGFRAGERVWSNSLGHQGRQGPTAQYAVVPADRLYRLPGDLDPDETVAVLHPAATAWLALVRRARLRPGERLLVEGAAGNVGRCLVELGVQLGAHVVGTAAAADLDRVRALGAEQVVDYRAPDLTSRLAAASDGGYHVAVDSSGHNRLDRTAPLLTLGARVVLLAGMASSVAVPARAIYLRDVSVLGFVISNAATADLADAAGWINDRLAAGGLRPRAVRRLPLGGTAEAHRMLVARTAGRLVIRPSL